MTTMNKSELVARVAANAALPKVQAARAVDAVFMVIGEELKQGGAVRATGFGTFGVTDTPARKGRNPRTGEVIDIAAFRKPTFRPGKGIKDRLNPQRKVGGQRNSPMAERKRA